MIRATLVRLGLAAAILLIVICVVLLPVALTLPAPGDAVAAFLLGPFESRRHIGNVVEAATPLLFTGTAVSLMFRAGMFNLGAEGAFYLGGVVASVAVLRLPLTGAALPASGLIAGALVGGLMCAVPGVLRARFGAPELVTSLMLNYAALYLGLYVLNHVIRDAHAGAMMSFRFPDDARLPRLVAGTRLHVGLPLGVGVCALGAAYLFFMQWGYETRVAGASPVFARHLGLRVALIAAGAQAIGGLCAALGGAVEVLGLYPRFSWTALPGQGWTGLVVAILARSNPLLVPPAAFALSYFQVGGDLLARRFDVPAETVGLMQALVIIGATASVVVRDPRFVRSLLGRAVRA